MNAIFTEEINSIIGVKGHFQCDQDLEMCYYSDPKMKSVGELAPDCLGFSMEMVDAAGLGSLKMITAFPEEGKITFFALNCEKAESPGIRFFGVSTTSQTDVDSVVQEIQGIV